MSEQSAVERLLDAFRANPFFWSGHQPYRAELLSLNQSDQSIWSFEVTIRTAAINYIEESLGIENDVLLAKLVGHLRQLVSLELPQLNDEQTNRIAELIPDLAKRQQQLLMCIEEMENLGKSFHQDSSALQLALASKTMITWLKYADDGAERILRFVRMKEDCHRMSLRLDELSKAAMERWKASWPSYEAFILRAVGPIIRTYRTHHIVENIVRHVTAQSGHGILRELRGRSFVITAAGRSRFDFITKVEHLLASQLEVIYRRTAEQLEKVVPKAWKQRVQLAAGPIRHKARQGRTAVNVLRHLRQTPARAWKYDPYHVPKSSTELAFFAAIHEKRPKLRRVRGVQADANWSEHCRIPEALLPRNEVPPPSKVEAAIYDNVVTVMGGAWNHWIFDSTATSLQLSDIQEKYEGFLRAGFPSILQARFRQLISESLSRDRSEEDKKVEVTLRNHYGCNASPENMDGSSIMEPQDISVIIAFRGALMTAEALCLKTTVEWERRASLTVAQA